MRGAAARRALRTRARARARRAQQADGLRQLAGLIDDTLRALGAQPAFAEALGGAARGNAARRHVPRHADGPARGTAHDGRAETSADTTAKAAGSTDATTAGSTAGPADLDEDHAETWELVHRAQDGDGEAFGALYDRYVDMVYRFVYFRVNDRALAEDFTSETFLRALRRINSISYQGRDIGAWFVTIARNIVLDHVKSARNRLESTTGETIETKEHEPSTENAVLTTLQNEQLMAAVAQLGDEQRECVLLRFVHGMSVNETATIMGKNDGAIKALQHRAVRKLADLVGGDLR